MKTKTLIGLALLGGTALSLPAWAQNGPLPPPVIVAQPAPPPQPVYVYEQKSMAGRQPLITAEQAQSIIDKFKAAYPKLGSPRMVLYVNRELIDENSGLRLTSRTEHIERSRQTATGATTNETAKNSSSQNEKTTGENRYSLGERKESTLADKQTIRDVERLFGRPLRMAGVTLADQRLATQVMADKPAHSLTSGNEQARKDRAALAQIADVAVEILISSKNVQVAEVSGDRTYALPDIQVTATQLKDAKILSQASSSDVMRGNPVYYARNFDVREITEATALALMEDMLNSVPGQPTGK